MEKSEIIKKRIEIKFLSHPTGLWMAVSADLPGLIVHGNSPEELEKKVPARVRDILEVEGYSVLKVELEPDSVHVPPEFGPPAFIAEASLSTASSWRTTTTGHE